VGSLSPPADARIRCALATTPVLAPPADDALRLVMGADTVIDPTLVRDLQARARPGQVLEVEADGAWVRVAPGPLVAGNGGTRLGPGAGTLRRAGSAGLEQALLRGLENPRDGYLDRLLRRRLSRPLTRLLLRTPVTPNAVTVVGIALGVAGGLLLDRVLSPLTTRDWHVFPVVFALAGRLGLLVPAAAVGANLFWVTGLVLLLRVLRRT